MSKNVLKTHFSSRRNFIKNSSLAVSGALLSHLPVRASAFVAGSDLLKVALIGCGKRGAGAAAQALSTSNEVKLVHGGCLPRPTGRNL